MRVKLEPETAFIGRKFAYIFLSIIFILNYYIYLVFIFFKFNEWKIKILNIQNLKNYFYLFS